MGLLLLWNGSVQGTAGDLPDIYLEWSPTTNPGAAPVWERIPLSDIRSIDINRGRNRELDQFQAGRMAVVLDNRDRHYDPEYSAGPNFGNVKPMRRIRLRAVWDTTYDLFSGFIDSWDQDYEMTKEAVCVVTATDAFKVLERGELRSSPYAEEVKADNPFLWFRLDEAAGSTTVFDAVNGTSAASFGSPTLGTTGMVTRDPGTCVTQSNETSGFGTATAPFVPAGILPPMSLEAIVRYTGPGSYVLTLMDGPTRGIFLGMNDGSGAAFFQTLDGTATTAGGGGDLRDGDPHHLLGTYDGSNLRLYVDGTLVDTVAVTGPTMTVPQDVTVGNIGLFAAVFPHGDGIIGDIDEAAIYLSALSSDRALAHSDARATPWAGDTTGERIERLLDAIGWSTVERDVDEGESVLQSADINGQTALAHAQRVRDTEFGELFILPDGKVRFVGRHNKWLPPYNDPLFTLSDDGSDLGYGRLKFNYDDQLIRNRVTISHADGLSFTANSTSSQDDFLIQSYSQTGLIGDVDSEAVDYANYVLNRYDEPLLRVQGIAITPQRNPATHFPAVLSADLVYQVNVERTPQGVGSAIDQTYTIEGVSHHIEPKFWRTDLKLSPADTPGAFILDSTSQGILDTNVLGF